MTEGQSVRYKKLLARYNAFMTVYPFTSATLENETWKWIKGYDGIYKVSNYGRIKSYQKGTEKIIKPSLSPHGYLYVALSKFGDHKNFRLHRLVAQAFISNPDHLSDVDHINGDKLNCTVENLRYVSHRENIHYARKMAYSKHLEDDNMKNIPAQVAWSDEIILTTEQLAEFYECSTTRIKQNFNNNKDHFVEGKHYFKLEGEDLKAFKSMVENFDLAREGTKLRVENFDPQISQMVRTIYLWTKRGCARHAKMLNTNKAWDVFEMLEDSYFSHKEKPVEKAEDKISLRERIKLLNEYINIVEDTVLRDELIRQAAILLN